MLKACCLISTKSGLKDLKYLQKYQTLLHEEDRMPSITNRRLRYLTNVTIRLQIAVNLLVLIVPHGKAWRHKYHVAYLGPTTLLLLSHLKHA